MKQGKLKCKKDAGNDWKSTSSGKTIRSQLSFIHLKIDQCKAEDFRPSRPNFNSMLRNHTSMMVQCWNCPSCPREYEILTLFCEHQDYILSYLISAVGSSALFNLSERLFKYKAIVTLGCISQKDVAYFWKPVYTFVLLELLSMPKVYDIF